MEPSSRSDPAKETKTPEETPDSILGREITALLRRLEETMKAHESTKIKLTSVPNPILTKLKKYITVFGMTEPAEHQEYFENVYKRNRIPILAGIKSDAWLHNNNVQIRFGEGVPDAPKGVNQVVVMLSSIYSTACKLRDEAQSRLEGLPEAAYMECNDLIYPDTILLHLYRIFAEVAPTKDVTTLRNIVGQLEDSLGISKGAAEPQTNGNPLGDLSSLLSGVAGSASGGGGLGKLLNDLTGMLGKFGIKPPEGAAMPTDKDINKILGDVFNNDKTQRAIGDIFGSLKDCKDFNEAVTKMLSGLNDPSLKSAITGTLQTTAIEAAAAAAKGPVGSEVVGSKSSS